MLARMGAPAVALAPGVYRIPTFGDFINSYAFLDGDGQVTLVDCGLARAPAKIVAALRLMGKQPADVTRILLTHAHSDHAGGAHAMVEASGAAGVGVHSADLEFIRAGHNAPPDLSTTSGRLFTRVPGTTFRSVAVAEELADGQLLPVAGGLRVHHTPGHSPGHVSLVHEPTGVLVTGDAIFNVLARMRWPVAVICASFSQNKQSAHLLGELDYSLAASTHGPEIRDRPREAIRDFLRRKG